MMRSFFSLPTRTTSTDSKRSFWDTAWAAILYRKNGGLVDHIGEIGSYGSAGGQGDGVQVYGFVHFDVFGMDFQDVYAAFQVGSVYDDTAVKAART